MATLEERARAAQERLDAFAGEQDWSHIAEELEDHFTITKVTDGRIWLESTIERQVFGPIELPRELTELLEEGWGLAAVIGKAKKRWQFVEVARILPV